MTIHKILLYFNISGKNIGQFIIITILNYNNVKGESDGSSYCNDNEQFH